jgi:hypothetical protein
VATVCMCEIDDIIGAEALVCTCPWGVCNLAGSESVAQQVRLLNQNQYLECIHSQPQSREWRVSLR